VTLFPTQLHTSRCRLNLAGQDAFNTITNIFSENRETLKLLMRRPAPADLADGLLTREALPPRGEPERLLPFLITETAKKEVIGIVSIYCGYPKQDALYLGDLFFRPAWQGQGYGAEVVAGLEQAAARAGFREIRLAVGLKNWLALRFWLGQGYSRITKISGSRHYGPDNFGNLELSKIIEP
jgi:GNAT superfamily N-acetyltransferase